MNNSNNNWEDARISVDGHIIHLEEIVEDLKKKVSRNETLGWIGIVMAILLAIPITLTQIAFNEIKDQNQEIKDQNQVIEKQNDKFESQIRELTKLVYESQIK